VHEDLGGRGCLSQGDQGDPVPGCEARAVQLTLVANQSLRTPASQHIKSMQVGSGFDVADNEIV
jgi:hypothetical protein